MKATRLLRLQVVWLVLSPLALDAQNVNWAEFLGGPEAAHYSPLTQVNTANADKLRIAWSYETGDDTSYTFCPLVVDNIAYVAAKDGALVALDATAGKEIWVHKFAPGGRFSGIAGQRGANYWESQDRSDRRIFVTAEGSLQAIDARTGKLVDSFADHGKLDLKIGIDRARFPLASRTAGRVFENLIILGSATGEGYLAPPGDIRAFDAVTGRLVWVFHTIPRPGEFGYKTWPSNAWEYMGGVDVWGEFSVDEKRGILYMPTASAKYELYGGDRPGNNLYADSILALNARTGKLLWYFQTVHHDLWDCDPDAAPQLVTVRHDGKMVDAVALASKNGFLYVFDRVTGKPLWPIVERPVPQSDVPGEVTSPTQPFPTVVPPFVRQGMTVKDMYTGFMTDQEKVWWKDRLSKARTGLFTPPALGDMILMPSVNGGALFFGTGADPANGTVYVVGKNMPSIIKLVPAGESIDANAGNLIPDRPRNGRGGAANTQVTAERRGRAVYEQSCQMCHGDDLKGDRGPEIDGAESELGADAIRTIIAKGKGGMPAIPSLPAPLVDDLVAFLTKPDAAPPGSAAPPAVMALALMRIEPPYPAGVKPPPSRYKTGYGNEPYVVRPPWTVLTAYDLNTGKIKWQTPYGDLPEAGPSDKLRGMVYPKSGPVITAGGLVLFAGNDSKLYVLNKDTGKLICTKDLPNGSLGVPAVYEVNGREFVLLAVAGGNGFPKGGRLAPGGFNPPAISKSYIAFALPEGSTQ
ncbi:MAG TPA: PQQ-binding-like beta-propeller repeat protein [Bryobacteraceae bacterium]|nr:PQQ-binding-like beta-propeller repeat protein [Bryobacteraceae bacterium]